MATRGIVVLVVMIAVLAGGGVSAAQTVESLQKEVEALKEAVGAMQKDLQGIKELLRGRSVGQAPAAPENPVISVQDAPVLGDRNAKVTLVDFSDYQCPFCRRHVEQTLPKLLDDYVKTGKARYVFRDFPIVSLHPQAPRLHQAAHCAGDQGKYWEMHGRIFVTPKQAELSDVVAHARALSLDVSRFEECVTGGTHAARVDRGVADGQQAGVRGTPTFFIGVTQGDGSVKTVRSIRGAQPFAAFKQAIESVLESAGR